MRTLDEVINEVESAWACPSSDEGSEYCDLMEARDDALHYLKDYRENQQAYEEGNRKAEEARERYLEAVKNCEEAENKYRKMENELNDIRREHVKQMKNDPLTWDELKEMTGKPVWVEHKYYNKWLIVYEVYENTIVLDGNGCYTQYFSDDNDKEVRWQAYRKERS